MKKILFFTGMCAFALLNTSCVSTTLTHEIAVTRDADGKVIQTVETEGIVQPNATSTGKIVFKTLQMP